MTVCSHRRAPGVLLGWLICGSLACGDDGVRPAPLDAQSDAWRVEAAVEADFVVISATIGRYHADFVHMSIRRTGWFNRYTIQHSPAPRQPERDWSRVHHWFGELHPDTFLEGRIDDGSGQGPPQPTTVRFRLPRAAGPERRDFPDVSDSGYAYITSIYAYADGHSGHPGFDAGRYEVELYAWYTGPVNSDHPVVDLHPEVQYLHHESPFASTSFVIH